MNVKKRAALLPAGRLLALERMLMGAPRRARRVVLNIDARDAADLLKLVRAEGEHHPVVRDAGFNTLLNIQNDMVPMATRMPGPAHRPGRGQQPSAGLDLLARIAGALIDGEGLIYKVAIDAVLGMDERRVRSRVASDARRSGKNIDDAALARRLAARPTEGSIAQRIKELRAEARPQGARPMRAPKSLVNEALSYVPSERMPRRPDGEQGKRRKQ